MRSVLLGVVAGGLVRRHVAEVELTSAGVGDLSAGLGDLCQPEHIGEVCASIDEGGLQELMTASAGDTADFLQAVGLDEKAGFTCEELCIATLSYAQSDEGGQVLLPPGNAVVCKDADCAEQVSVSRQAVAALALQELEAVTVTAEGVAEGDEDRGDLQQIETDEEPQPGDLTFTPQELTRSLMVLFDVFAVPSGPPAGFLEDEESLLEGVNDPEFGPKIRRDRYAQYTEFAMKGAAIVSAAIKRVDSNPDIISTWFGDDSVSYEVKKMFQRQLKTILDLRIQKGDCSGSTLAYVMVWTNSRTGEFVKSDRDSKGQYVVHMCEYFWAVIRDTDYRYGTIIHESAHHHGPTDVKLANGQTAYGRRNNLKLVREQGPYGDNSPEQGTMRNADNFMTAALVLAKDGVDPAPTVPVPTPRPTPRPTWRPWRPRPTPRPTPPPTQPQAWYPDAACSTACGASTYNDRAISLSAGQCAKCEQVTRERWGGSGCGDGQSTGEKTFFKKVCCYPQDCIFA